jgi:hypothetical protein
MNLPAAIAVIIRLCPEQPGQARALAVFSSISGIGGSMSRSSILFTEN